jgi:phospholipid/cholesterol/gamma-HCH transport system permease protein
VEPVIPFKWEGPDAEGTVRLYGNLNAFSAPRPFLTKKQVKTARNLTFDLKELEHLDLNGAAFLLSQFDLLKQMGISSKVQNLSSPLAPIWELAQKSFPAPDSLVPQKGPGPIEQLGENIWHFFKDLFELTTFFGEVLVHFWGFLRRPWRARWASIFTVAEKSVVDAIPVTCLVAFLVGLILAFQSAMLMQVFGVDIFVADLVGIAMIRELGTLLTAIVLTGRSGSAFSSELASMKSNQEIDAFVTMGLSPARDLALPRILAMTLATPLLTILADLAGLLGGNIVLMSLGHPYMVFWEELSSHIDISDIATGLFKSFVFGFVVALIGCQRGLYAESGPSAVGEATTHGVVTNILVIAILDSLFAVLFYALSW